MKKKNKIVIISMLVLFILLISNSIVFADGADGIYAPITGGGNPFGGAANIILGWIKWIGVAILIGAIIVKGIHYVSASPDGKAQLKKEITMLAVGAVLLFGFLLLVNIVYDLVKGAGL